MPTDSKNTTGAVHVTSFDLDISALRESAEQTKTILEDISKTALSTKQSLNGLFDGVNSGANSKKTSSGGSGDSQLSYLRSLLKQYYELQKKFRDVASTTENLDTSYYNLDRQIKANITSLQTYIEQLVNEEKLSKNAPSRIKAMVTVLQKAQTEYAKLNASLDEGNVGYEKTIQKLTSLQKKYTDLSTSFNNVGNTENSERAIQAAQSLEQLTQEFVENKISARELMEQYVLLNKEYTEFTLVLSQLKNEQSQQPVEQNYDKTTESLTKLEAKLLTVATSFQKLGQTDLADGVRDSVEEIRLLTDTITQNGTVTEQQASKVETYENAYRQLLVTLARMKDEQSQQPVTLSTEQAQKQITILEQKYSALQLTISRSKLDTTHIVAISKKADEARIELEQLAKSFENGEKSASEVEVELKKLQERLTKIRTELNDTTTEAYETGEGFKDLGDKAEATGGIVADFVKKLSDKAKWLIAYSLINEIGQAFGNMFDTIKDTEDAVIQLQRVLNDNSLSNSAIADELYDIAYEYGQIFDNVQETAVLFAQTGKSWTEVIDATRATMLALNTAELDTSSATSGLIAVMSQFKIEASDLETVIDKINITADNFPVTSENIVAALQRAGSAAHNYGMTLEETISIITALSEATGRTGENLGTSLNSLINFSMKESSLEAFSDYLGGISLKGKDVIEVWTLLSASIKDGGESLAELMSTSEDFADLFSEEMAETVGAMSEYTAAVGNAEDVYSSAGVYRKNYFIALLNNFDTALEAIQNMNDAEGYSISENEKYMESLTASLNQLQIAFQELAEQAAQNGLLDALKNVINITTQVVKLTQSIGGLRTGLIAILAVVTAVQKQKLATSLIELRKRLDNAKASTDALAIKTADLNVKIATLKMTISGWLSVLGFVGTAISAIVGYYQEWVEQSKEAREELIKLGDEANNTANDLITAYNNYKNAVADGAEDIEEKQIDLLKVLGYSEDDLSILEKRYGSVTDAIEKLVEIEMAETELELENSVKARTEALKDLETQANTDIDALKELLGIAPDVNTMADDSYTLLFGKYLSAVNVAPETYDQLIDKINFLDEAIDDANETLTQGERANNSLYQSLVSQRKILMDARDEIDKNENALKKLRGETEDVVDTTTEAEQAIKDALSNISTEIEKVGENFEDASEKIDGFQSAFNTVSDAVDSYNQNGYMTVDTLQSLLELEPEYINLLEIHGEKLYINGEALENLTQVNEDYMTQMVASKVAEEALTLAEQYHKVAVGELTVEELKLQTATSLLTNDVAQVAYQYMQGKITADEFAEAIANVGNVALVTGSYLQQYVADVTEILNQYNSLLGLTSNGSGYYKWVSGSSSTSSSSADKEQLQSQKELLQKQKESIKDYYDDLEEAKKKEKEASKERYEELQEEVEKRKEASNEYYENEIDKLQETQEAQDRLNDALDYYANRQKILRNLEQAQARSGIEWREKEIEYQESLNELDSDWRDKLTDWAIDDQIDELERLKDEAEKGFDAEIEALKELAEQAEKAFEAEIDNIKEAEEAAVDAIEAEIDTIEEAIDALSKSVSNSVANGAYIWVSTVDETAKETESKATKTIKAIESKTTTALKEAESTIKTSAQKMYQSFGDEFFTPTLLLLDEFTEKVEEVAKTNVDAQGMLPKDEIALNAQNAQTSTFTPVISSYDINELAKQLGISVETVKLATQTTDKATINTQNNQITVVADIKDAETADVATSNIVDKIKQLTVSNLKY